MCKRNRQRIELLVSNTREEDTKNLYCYACVMPGHLSEERRNKNHWKKETLKCVSRIIKKWFLEKVVSVTTIQIKLTTLPL